MTKNSSADTKTFSDRKAFANSLKKDWPLPAVAIIVALLLAYSATSTTPNIPNFEIPLNENTAKRLAALSPIKITPAGFFSQDCFSHQAGLSGHYVTAKGTSIERDIAHWTCLEAPPCPDMTIVMVAPLTAGIRGVKARKARYSKTDIINCATSAMYAKIGEKRPTPGHKESRRNKDSWQSSTEKG